MAYHFLSYDSYRRICNVIHTLEDVIANINDGYEATNIVWSSQKIMEAITDVETEIDTIVDSNITNKVTLGIEACPAEEDMELNKLYYEPMTDADGNTYYDNYIFIDGIGKLFLGSSTFSKDRYYTKEEMDERYGAIDHISNLSTYAAVESRAFYRIMNQEITACENMFLSTHDNLSIPNAKLNGLTLGNIYPIIDGFILETYRNGLAYWSIYLERNSDASAPTGEDEDVLISEILSNKDEFNKPCSAWPEIRDVTKNQDYVIPLHSKMLYGDDEYIIRYCASLVIKNESDTSTDSSKICIYLRSCGEVPASTKLYGSACFTINHSR